MSVDDSAINLDNGIVRINIFDLYYKEINKYFITEFEVTVKTKEDNIFALTECSEEKFICDEHANASDKLLMQKETTSSFFLDTIPGIFRLKIDKNTTFSLYMSFDKKPNKYDYQILIERLEGNNYDIKHLSTSSTVAVSVDEFGLYVFMSRFEHVYDSINILIRENADRGANDTFCSVESFIKPTGSMILPKGFEEELPFEPIPNTTV